LATRGVTAQEARAIALDRLARLNVPFSVEAIGPLPNGDVTVRISVPASAVTIGFWGVSEDSVLQTSITMRREGT